MTTREISSGKHILPLWHNINRAEMDRFSPILAEKMSVSTVQGLDAIVDEILRAF